MRNKTALLVVLYMFSGVTLAQCHSHDVLGAKYRLTTTYGSGEQSRQSELLLWRNGKQVAYEYPQSHITEIWGQTTRGRLHLVRHFDVYQRAIEYQPGEINHGKGDSDWGLKYQLISNQLKDSMQRYAVVGEDCALVEKYKLNTSKGHIELEWMPAQHLVKNLSVTKEGVVLTWSLENIITDSNRIHGVFKSRGRYQTTDYIDIGDNESDPFLLKMMHLGSTAQGSSWVYETSGYTAGNLTPHAH